MSTATQNEPELAPIRTRIPSSRGLKLAYLTAEYPKVSHTFIRREIQELERRGHDVTRVSIRPAGKLVDPADVQEANRTLACLDRSRWELLAQSSRWAVSRPWRWIRAVRQALQMNRVSDRGIVRHAAYLTEAAFLANRFRSLGINHVHVHFGTNAATVARLMKQLAGITYSLTVHGPGEFDAPIGLSLAEKVADATFTAAISHFCFAQLTRWVKPEHWNRIHIVRCTIDPKFLAPPTPVTSLANRLVCVGRLTPQKNPLQLLQAFARHVENGLPGHLVYAGDGELRPRLEDLIRQHQLQDRVTITGWLSEAEVQREIQASRAVVLASSAEGLPVVLMEALAVARPVISTYTAAIPELVRPGENGWLVPAGDSVALGDALQEVVHASTARLSEMGLAGRALVEKQHHPEIEGEKLERIFRQYLSS
jgi:glycosyltransferase involved in cell wall biosynthesis